MRNHYLTHRKWGGVCFSPTSRFTAFLLWIFLSFSSQESATANPNDASWAHTSINAGLLVELDPIIPILECVEDLGNGKMKATFGYNNPNETEVIVPPGNSRVVWNGTLRQEKVLNNFQLGSNESVLEVEFDKIGIENGVTWIIRIPKRASMEASADATSTSCKPDISSIDNFKAIAISTSQIDLSWDEPTSNEPFTYTIERSLTGDDPWEVAVSELPQTITAYSDQELEEFTIYYYRITAGNQNSTSFASTTQASTLSSITTVFNENGKIDGKVSLDLVALHEGQAGETPSELVYQFNESGDVLVEIIAFLNPNTISELISRLQTNYGRVSSHFVLDPQTYINDNINTIDVYLPVSLLLLLNDEASVNFVHPAYPASLNNGPLGETGVLSQGDVSQTTNDVRQAFRVNRLNPETGLVEPLQVDGTGVKVGVLSNSFNTQPFSGSDSRYVVDQKNLDLPGPDNPNYPLPVDYNDPTFQDTDEGRAMLHIIHDIAPGAQLGFQSGTLSLNKFVVGINQLSINGYQVLVDDITFLTESFFQRSGPAFEAIEAHVNRSPGNSYFTSAGNFSDKSWMNIFNPMILPDGSVYPAGTTGWIHNQELAINVDTDGEYIMVLQWDEPAASQGSVEGAMTDLDLTVVDPVTFRPIAGNNKISIARDPTEILIIKSSASRSARLVVTCECDTPPTNLAFRVVIFKTTKSDGSEGLTFPSGAPSGPTITGHAMSDHVQAIGASFYGFYGNSTGPEIEPFSSFGGVLPNGDEVNPKFTAPDGGNTGVLSIGEEIVFDEDTQFKNFFGTSASAPHAAGAAALMLSAITTWHPGGIPSGILTDPNYATGDPADESIGLFIQTATPVSNSAQGGAGLLNAEDAFKQIANQTPFLNGEFEVEEGKVLSGEETMVTLFGDYFIPDSKVLFDGMEVPTTYVSETEIQALIPAFSGQGKLVVGNNPSLTGAGDGGDGNGIDLLDGRRAINIIADDAEFEFGKDFTNLTYTVGGLEEGETLVSLGLPDVVLISTATAPYPDVNNYTVFVEFAEPLTQEQKEQFIFNLTPGTLSITHKELTIRPQDITAIYGEEPEIVMDYFYDATGIADNEHFLNTIRTEHQSTYLREEDGNGLVNRFSAVVNRFSAVVNENPARINELLDLIENSNWVATRTTIENRSSPVVNGFNLVGFDADQLIDYLDNPLVGNSGSIENRFSAVVNGADLVNGLTSIYDPIENRFSAVVNRFSAVVNRFSAVVNVPLGDENDMTDYSELLAIVDVEDGAPEGTDPDELPPTEVYSIDVITGIDVTPTEEDRHYIAPGAPLSPFFANFNKTLHAGRLFIAPRPLTVDLNDDDMPVVINYGEPQPGYNSAVDPLSYDDEATVEYSLDPEPTNPIGAGTYSVLQSTSIADPEGNDKTINYEITYVDGSLVVKPGTLMVHTDDILIESGVDLLDVPKSSTISGFITAEDEIDVFPPDGPVFLYESSEYENAGRVAGTYVLTTSVTPTPENYNLVLNDARLFVNLADGKRIRVYLDCVQQNKGQSEFPFTAYFHYENDNDVSIFIEPMSAENILIGTSFDASALPFEFLPGTDQFAVPFVGELRWNVSTFGSTHQSSQQVDSDNLKGQMCKPNEILVNGRTANPNPNGDDLTSFNSEELQFYPNPVEDYLVVRVNQGFTSQDYQLYDSRGMLHTVNAVIDPVQSTAEFDLSDFETGLYLLKLNIDGTTAIIRILRE